MVDEWYCAYFEMLLLVPLVPRLQDVKIEFELSLLVGKHFLL